MDRRMAATEPPPSSEPESAAPPEAAPAAPADASPAYIGELEQLASLRDSGVLTDEEFEAKKREILGL